MRVLIRAIDRLLSRLGGIYEYWQDPQSILRLQISRAHHPVSLPGLQIQMGDPVLALHYWNAHLPAIPGTGANLTWALQYRRMLISSFREMAKHIVTNPRLADLSAIFGVYSLLPDSEESGGAHFLRRLGFTILPYKSPFGCFGEFFENFYSWLLVYAYNPGSLTTHRLFRLNRFEIWISREEFLRRYLTEEISVNTNS